MATRIVTLGFVAALCGCSTIQDGGPSLKANRPCGDHVCFITVTVIPGKPCSDPNNIVVTPDPAKIAASTVVTLKWDIDDTAKPPSTGYTFDPTKGIQFSSDSTITGCQPLGPPGSPTGYQCQDRSGDPEWYKYTVNLKKGGVACAPKDPWVANGQ